jgi:hypothetical protein
MVGGMISSTLLTLLVIPAIYSLWREREMGAVKGFLTTTSGWAHGPAASLRPNLDPE